MTTLTCPIAWLVVYAAVAEPQTAPPRDPPQMVGPPLVMVEGHSRLPL